MNEIKILDRLEPDDRRRMKDLVRICSEADGLDYPLDMEDEGEPRNMPASLMYMVSGKLAGFIYIFEAPQGRPELYGFAHPLHRRQGIFTALYEEVLWNLNKREFLLVVMRAWEGGTAFARKLGLEIMHSEYRMELRDPGESKKAPKTSEGIVRTARASDLDVLAALGQECFEVSNMKDEKDHLRKAIVSERQTLLVYEDKGRIWGMANLFDESAGTGIYHLCVASSRRKSGIGSRLIEESVRRVLTKDPLGKVFLEVLVDNDRALSIYRKKGFRETAVFDYYLGGRTAKRRKGNGHDS